jgi:hypothetical protein
MVRAPVTVHQRQRARHQQALLRRAKNPKHHQELLRHLAELPSSTTSSSASSAGGRTSSLFATPAPPPRLRSPARPIPTTRVDLPGHAHDLRQGRDGQLERRRPRAGLHQALAPARHRPQPLLQPVEELSARPPPSPMSTAAPSSRRPGSTKDIGVTISALDQQVRPARQPLPHHQANDVSHVLQHLLARQRRRARHERPARLPT